VATVVYSRNALANLERALVFLEAYAPGSAPAAFAAIASAVSLVAQHPFVGRVVEGEIRELIISFGRTGYVALYRYVAARDEVQVLAIRHQRELDYP
jgi:plasmid stabilization system protein ParE